MSTNVEQGVAHDEKSIFFIFCLKIPYGGPRNVVVFFFIIEMFFWTRKINKSMFLPQVSWKYAKKTCLTPSSKLLPVLLASKGDSQKRSQKIFWMFASYLSTVLNLWIYF